jgi:hypothetical protein
MERIAMNHVESLKKSLVREQLITGLFAALCYFTCAGLGIAVDLKFLNPVVKQFIPLCGAVGLLGTSHSFLSFRLVTALQALTASPASQKAE